MHVSNLAFFGLAIIVVADSQESQPVLKDTKSSGCSSLVVDCTLGYNSSMNQVKPLSPSPTGSFHDKPNQLPEKLPFSESDPKTAEKMIAEHGKDEDDDDDDDDDDKDDKDDDDKDDDDKDDDDKDDDDKDDEDKDFGNKGDDYQTIGGNHQVPEKHPQMPEGHPHMPEKQHEMPEIYHQAPEEYILKTITITSCVPTVMTSVITMRKPGPTQDRPYHADMPMPTGRFPKPIDNKIKPEIPKFTGAANVNQYSTFLAFLAGAIAFLL